MRLKKSILQLERNIKQGVKNTCQVTCYVFISLTEKRKPSFKLIYSLVLLLINIIVERVNIANTICLPLHSLGETRDNKVVSVAGWGYTKLLDEGEWHPKVKVVGQGMYHYSITDY